MAQLVKVLAATWQPRIYMIEETQWFWLLSFDLYTCAGLCVVYAHMNIQVILVL